MAEFVPSKIPPADEARAPGMDHAHHPFRTLPDAPRFAWPDGARIAFTVTLMLDYWELDPPADASRDPRIVSPLGKFFPDWLTWSQREYGARVGIFRVLDVLDRFGVTPSVALGSAAAKRYPELVDELMRRNACFMAHGTFATRRITSRMSEADERALHRRGARRGGGGDRRGAARLVRPGFQRIGATRRRCWRRPASPTPPIGRATTGRFCSGHTTAACSRCRRSRNGTTWNACGCAASRRRCGRTTSPRRSTCCTQEGGGVFNLTLHPWIAGQAHRIRCLREALGRVLGKPAIWRATTDEVARFARPQIDQPG